MTGQSEGFLAGFGVACIGCGLAFESNVVLGIGVMAYFASYLIAPATPSKDTTA